MSSRSGWGIAYVDRTVKERVALCGAAGVTVCLGGTLLEVCAAQGKVDELRGWAIDLGVDAVEVSNGLQALRAGQKTGLVRTLAADFQVFAETGAKDGEVPVVTADWLEEMQADLAAGARWVIAEGRESGTVGLYTADGSPRAELVDAMPSGLAWIGSFSRHRRNPSRSGSSAGSGPARTWATCR